MALKFSVLRFKFHLGQDRGGSRSLLDFKQPDVKLPMLNNEKVISNRKRFDPGFQNFGRPSGQTYQHGQPEYGPGVSRHFERLRVHRESVVSSGMKVSTRYWDHALSNRTYC